MTIHDLKSRGTTTQYLDERGDFQTTFSGLESDAVIRVEFENDVVGLSTQLYLAPLEEVEEIAEELDVEPPDHANGKRLSTDILVDVARPRGSHRIAIDVKYTEDLDKPRNKEKRDIQRMFWMRRGVEFRVETEVTLPAEYRRNLRHALACAQGLSSHELGSALALVRGDLESLLRQYPYAMIGHLTDLVDRERSLEVGTTMTVLWAAIWQGHLAADLLKPIRPSNRALVLWPIVKR